MSKKYDKSIETITSGSKETLPEALSHIDEYKFCKEDHESIQELKKHRKPLSPQESAMITKILGVVDGKIAEKLNKVGEIAIVSSKSLVIFTIIIVLLAILAIAITSITNKSNSNDLIKSKTTISHKNVIQSDKATVSKDHKQSNKPFSSHITEPTRPENSNKMLLESASFVHPPDQEEVNK